MQRVTFTQFKLLKASDIKESKSFQVTADGELLCYIVIPHGEPLIAGNLTSHLDEMILQNNNYGGKDIS